MSDHNHLDSLRRDRGECPACDDAWRAQDERLAQTDPRTRAHKQIEHLVEREGKLGEQRYGKRAQQDG